MNEIWKPLLQMQMQGRKSETLHYLVKNNRVSPYMEILADSLYEADAAGEQFSQVDVNPYLRFSEIFYRLISEDDLGYEEFQEGLASVLLHYLGDLDQKCRKSRREVYLEILLRELSEGCLCNPARLCWFRKEEKRCIANGLMMLYETADYMGALLQVTKRLLPYCQIYIRDHEELVFYMRETQQEESRERLELLVTLFLPVFIRYTIHWTKTYGVIGSDVTMGLEEFVL